MSEAATNAVKGAQNQAGSATKGTPVDGIQGKVKGATDVALGTVQSVGNKVAAGGQRIVDRIFPPDKREAFLAKLQAFVLANPKLSTFLGMNIALTGVPLGLFILFSVTVFLFSLIVGVLAGVLAAVFFTLAAVGAALVFVLPTVLFTTGAACFFFLWGLGGYYILRWANSDKPDQEAPEGSAIGDKLNRLTGGRLDGLMESTRATSAKKEIKGYNDRFTKPASQPNGSVDEDHETSDTTSREQTPTTTKVDRSKPTPASDTPNKHNAVRTGAAKPATNAVSAAKGGLSGATGLAG